MKVWFTLEVDDGFGWVDITDNVMVEHEGLSLEEHADLLDKLVFTLRSTDSVSVIRYIDSFTDGMPVRLWFGYGEGMKRSNQTAEMFSGFIGRLQAKYPKTGYPVLEVTAFDPAWLLTQKKPPVQKTWPGIVGAKWTYDDLVRNVMKPYSSDISIGSIQIPDAYKNIVFDEKHPAVQKADESDWKFLKRLAFDDYDEVSMYDKKGAVNLGCECIVYVVTERGKAKLYFAPESTKMNETSKVCFYYPMHGTKIPLEQDFTSDNTVLIAEDITVDEDRDTASDVLVQVPADAFRDNLTEEQIQIVNAGGGFKVDMETFVSSFDIDHDLIAQDEQAGAIKWGVSDYSAGKVGWDDVKKYVRLKIVHQPAGSSSVKSEVPVTNEDLKDPVKRAEFVQKAIGKRKKKRKTNGFTMKIDLAAGNYNIHPRQTYPVTNIGGKYSTDSKKKVKWFCEMVTHKIGQTYRQSLKLTM